MTWRIIIIDSCHSGASFDNFRNDPHKQSADGKRTAVIFSSQADQFANFNTSYTEPLFSEMLTHSLPISVGESFSDAVYSAQIATHRKMRFNCEGADIADLIKSNPDISHYSLCTQMAQLFDPYGLLDDIIVK